jgi:hypothetical protein
VISPVRRCLVADGVHALVRADALGLLLDLLDRVTLCEVDRYRICVSVRVNSQIPLYGAIRSVNFLATVQDLAGQVT